jgi:acetoin utilization deacetylase AcuC-like enzyme
MGFCLFNNVALAARRALDANLSRVLIVDFDVHHGNGTQDFFYESGEVLFISTHQQGIYPGTGRLEETGVGAGQGCTINLPLPAGVGDAGFAAIFEEVIRPAAARFRPEMLFVSAGFDAHWADPLASLALSTTGYFKLVQSLAGLAADLCGGRICLVLEGGYDGPALAASVLASFHALLGDEAAPDPLGPAPRREPDISALLGQARRLHRL